MNDEGSAGLHGQVPREVVTPKGRGRRKNPVNRKTALLGPQYFFT